MSLSVETTEGPALGLRKQNRCRFLKTKKTGQRSRNHHSIDAKSPIKIPSNCFRKQDVAQRNNPDLNPQEPSLAVEQVSCLKGELLGSTTQDHNQRILWLEEQELIDCLWEATAKLERLGNPLLDPFLPCLQDVIKEMMKSISASRIDDSIPVLENSQKIDFTSHNIGLPSCECSSDNLRVKPIKQRALAPEIIKSCHSGRGHNKYSLNACEQSPNPYFPSQQPAHQKWNPKDETQELELRKILYILEGQKQPTSNQLIQQSIWNSSPQNRTSNQKYYQSLSSFNPNPGQDSGITLLEIEKCEDFSPGFCAGAHQSDQSQADNTSNSTAQMSKSSCKRKVLQDIIGMLNNKYNKNIKLI